MASKLALNSHHYSLHLITIIVMTMSFLIASDSHDHHDSHKLPFEFLKHLEGIKKGDRNINIHELRKYLQRFGYLNTNPTKTLAQTHSLSVASNNNDDEAFDDLLETAVKTYQKNYKLEPTGTLDPKTLSKMSMPRCGISDFVNNETRMQSKLPNKKNRKLLRTVSRYAFFSRERIWPSEKYSLTYSFAPGTPTETEKAVSRAFQTWAGNTHFEFSRAQSKTRPDISVSFERGDHGDGSPFDGSGGTLAHAFPPTDGRLHNDTAELWSIGAVDRAFDVETVALHEIGHILGLMHSSVEGAIMYPHIVAGITKGLHEDDIAGISDLYNVAV